MHKFFLITALFATISLAEDLSKQIIRQSHTDTFENASSIHLDSFRGDVNIEGWEKSGVEVTVVKATGKVFDAKNHAAADQLLERTHVKAELKDGQLAIATDLPKCDRNALMIDYVIHAPRGTKIEVAHGDGGVFVTGIAADMNVKLHRGEITLSLPPEDSYAFNTHIAIGDVYTEFDGSNHRRRMGFTHDFTSPGANGSAAHQVKLAIDVGDAVLLKAVK